MNRPILESLGMQLTPTTEQLHAMMKEFQRQMRTGLEGRAESLKMIPTYVEREPTGRESGEFYAIDIGGTNLRVLKVGLQDGRQPVVEAEFKKIVPKRIRTGTPALLFDFIADIVQALVENVKEDQKGTRPFPLGYTFSFPVNQTGIASGILLHWTKEWNVEGLEDHEVVEPLNGILKQRGIPETVTVLVNDTVGTWAAVALTDRRCCVGVILGTGSNAAYVERRSAIAKLPGSKNASPEDIMVINIEWGNFQSDALRKLQTKWDHQVNAATTDRDRQHFEKMIAGKYLGEIAQSVLVDLLGWSFRPRKGTNEALTTEDLSAIKADDSPDLDTILRILAEVGVEKSSRDERQAVKIVCELVAQRSAALVSTAIAAILSHAERVGTDSVVAIDGSVYAKYPGFKGFMEKTLADLLGKEKASKVHLEQSKDGSGIGAAVLAAIVSEKPATPS